MNSSSFTSPAMHCFANNGSCDFPLKSPNTDATIRRPSNSSIGCSGSSRGLGWIPRITALDDTGRNTATKQGHLLEWSEWVNFDEASRVEDSVFGESGSVEEMVDWVPIFGGKPALPVPRHHAFEGIHSELLAQIGLCGFAVGAVAAFPVEDRHHQLLRRIHQHILDDQGLARAVRHGSFAGNDLASSVSRNGEAINRVVIQRTHIYVSE
nr:hypothetical protein Iba_chr05eCG9800 [Ipomoea batatas]